MKGDWPKDKIDAIHKLVDDQINRVKQAVGCDGVAIIAIFNDGEDYHLFDAADCELSAPELYSRMLVFHLEALQKLIDEPVTLN